MITVVMAVYLGVGLLNVSRAVLRRPQGARGLDGGEILFYLYLWPAHVLFLAFRGLSRLLVP